MDSTIHLTDYVRSFYQLESIESICKKYNVSKQVVAGVIRKLNKADLINTRFSYSALNKASKQASNDTSVGVSVDISINFSDSEKKEQEKKAYQKAWYQKRKLLKQLTEVEVTQQAFTNHNGAGKMECRRIVSEYIGKVAGRNPKILTLPSDKWIWEKEILKCKSESKFTAVEYNTEIFNEMVKNYAKSPELSNSVECMYNCPMSEVITKSKTDEFSHMILDYCGLINSFQEEINEVLTRDIVRIDGIISITLSKSSRHNNDSGKEISNILSAIPKNMFGSNLSDVEICTKLSITKMVLNQGAKYKIVDTNAYNDTNGQGMMLFVIQRLK